MSSFMESASVVTKILTGGNVLGLVVLYVLAFALIVRIRRPRLPPGLPVVGYRGGLFSGLKTFFGVMHVQSWMEEGYGQYNKHGHSFVLPGVLGMDPRIVLPREQLQWLVDQPDDVLSTSEAHYDDLYGEYSFMTPDLLRDPYHEHVVHRSLSRSLASLIPEIEDEVQLCLDDALGTDTDSWKEINVWDTVFKIIPRLTNRILVGETLSRNPDYMDNAVAFAGAVMRNSLVLRACPRALHPVVGRLLGIITTRYFRHAAALTVPLIEERLAAFERHAAGDPAFEDWTPPNDYISWHIRLARAEGRADEIGAARIAQRLLPLHFAAIHTTSLTTHGTLLHLAAADPARGFMHGIRKEAARVRAEESGGRWSKAGLARLHRADSALQESMRAAPFMQNVMLRKVVAADGVSIPAEGWHAPRGALLVLPLAAITKDAGVFAASGEYDAFRYSRAREEFDARPGAERGAEEGLKLMQRTLVATGDSHLPSGHGRHACPGRFFVAYALKMDLAYLALNYDIKPLPSLPPSRWMGNGAIPDMRANIQVKRRMTAEA